MLTKFVVPAGPAHKTTAFFIVSLVIPQAMNLSTRNRTQDTDDTDDKKVVKVLCLHGYQQNMKDMREKSGGFRKYFGKTVKFDFISAPNKIEHGKDMEKDPRAWWLTHENYTYDRNEPDKCFGFQESVNVINEKCKTDGPYDGLLGFSQGAAMAALVIASDQMNEIKRFQFVILFSGFKSQNKAHSSFYQKMIDLPSLHVMGQKDKYVDRSKSEELLQCFSPKTAEVVLHDKGHIIACGQDLKLRYQNFLKVYAETS